eukprot:3089005-Rhodomonas_salina.3
MAMPVQRGTAMFIARLPLVLDALSGAAKDLQVRTRLRRCYEITGTDIAYHVRAGRSDMWYAVTCAEAVYGAVRCAVLTDRTMVQT